MQCSAVQCSAVQCSAACAQPPPHQETVESREPVQSRRSSAESASALTPAQCCIGMQRRQSYGDASVARRSRNGKHLARSLLAHPGAHAAAEEEGDAAASSTAWRQAPAVGHGDLRCGRFCSDAAAGGISSCGSGGGGGGCQLRPWLQPCDDPSCTTPVLSAKAVGKSPKQGEHTGGATFRWTS